MRVCFFSRAATQKKPGMCARPRNRILRSASVGIRGLFNIAHLFSMRTNSLSLKLCERLPPGQLIHRGHGAPRNFFATLPGGGKTSFPPFFALDGRARNQAVTRSAGLCAFVIDEGKRQLFAKRRLRIHKIALADRLASAKVFSRLERACSRVQDGPRISFPHNSCVWRVKAHLWCCVKFR
jgi:hypothetical protein